MLQPVAMQIQISDFSQKSDCFIFKNDTHFTISGLFRVARNVIKSFVFECDKVEKETINWRDQLPGIIKLEIAPQYWICSVSINPMHQFSGLLRILVDSTSNNLPDMRESLQDLQLRFSHLSSDNKQYALAVILLYNTIVCKESRSNNHEIFLEKNKAMLEKCHLANIVLASIPIDYSYQFSYTIEDVEKHIASYGKNKHKKKCIRLPRKIETIIYLRIAEISLSNEDLSSFQKYMDEAIYNSCGSKDVQEQMILSRNNHVAYNNQNYIRDTFKIMFDKS